MLCQVSIEKRKHLKTLLSVALSLFLSISVLAGPIKPPKGFSGRAYNSTLVLYGTLNDKIHSICSTTVYEAIPGGYHLITAGHCVEDVPSNVVFSVADNIGEKLMPVKVLKAREEGGIDFAELELLTDKKYDPISLGTEDGTHVGDVVINPNFSAMVSKQLSLGRISSQPFVVSEDVPEDAKGYFLVQVFGTEGSSGSAMISEKTHKIIGITIYGYDENIGMGIEPISLYQKFLSEPGQVHPTEKTAADVIDDLIKSLTGK